MVLDGAGRRADLGFTDALSVAIHRTVVQLLAPDQLLGRASSLITVFSQATNGLGAILAGAAAKPGERMRCWSAAICF
jgi:hypothetical protein